MLDGGFHRCWTVCRRSPKRLCVVGSLWLKNAGRTRPRLLLNHTPCTSGPPDVAKQWHTLFAYPSLICIPAHLFILPLKRKVHSRADGLTTSGQRGSCPLTDASCTAFHDACLPRPPHGLRDLGALGCSKTISIDGVPHARCAAPCCSCRPPLWPVMALPNPSSTAAAVGARHAAAVPRHAGALPYSVQMLHARALVASLQSSYRLLTCLPSLCLPLNLAFDPDPDLVFAFSYNRGARTRVKASSRCERPRPAHGAADTSAASI